MISAQTVALKRKMHLYVVQMEMPTGKGIYIKNQTGQGFEEVSVV
jgi:hypothetical protein